VKPHGIALDIRPMIHLDDSKNVSEELNLYQQESKSCALSIKLETFIKINVSGKSS
jgi:hypothetical protein